MKIFRLETLLLVILLQAYSMSGAFIPVIPFKTMEGKTTSLSAYSNHVVLIVNVASQCGYTRQYKPLEVLYRKYQDRGFIILGFPCNDFGGQEPGSLAEIRQFCTSKFDVTFPLCDKISVKPGPNQHPLYAALTGKNSPFPGEVKWNFGKFLIGKNGGILARFESGDEPDSEKVTKAIEAALAK
jgi:glutathione peroxidase